MEKIWLHTEQRLRKNLLQRLPMGACGIHVGRFLRVESTKSLPALS